MSRIVLALVGLLGVAQLAGAGPVPSQPPDVAPAPAGVPADCTLTGRLLPPGTSIDAPVGPAAAVDDLWRDPGVVLDRADRWLVPAGHRPVLVVEGSDRLGPTRIRTVVAGRVVEERPLRLVGEYRAVAEIAPLPSTSRLVGIKIDATICEIALAVAVDRDPWSTATGAFGLVLTGLLSIALGLIATPSGGRRRRYLLALPVGGAWGLAQLPFWYEWGLIGPFRPPPPWPAFVGAALALALVRFAPSGVRWVAARRPAGVAAAVVPPLVGLLLAGSLVAGSLVGLAGVGPAAGEASAPVITPERAEVLVIRALAADRELVAGGSVVGVTVGVPARQDAYPAWFVGLVTVRAGGEESWLWVRFDRASAGEPWRMAVHPVDRDLTPMRDSAGWLAPPGAAAEVPAPPGAAAEAPGAAELPRRYLDLVVRAARTGEAGDGPGFRLDEPGSLPAEAAAGGPAGVTGPVTVAYEPVDGKVVGEPVPLADGTVLVWFSARLRQLVSNQPADCAGQSLYWSDDEPAGRFRELTHVIEVTAWARWGADGEVVVNDENRASRERAGVPC